MLYKLHFLEHKYIHLDSWAKLIALRIENSDTVKTIKENIQEKVEIPYNQQEIIFEGKVLQDDCILSEFGIQYSKLKVVLNLIGKNGIHLKHYVAIRLSYSTLYCYDTYIAVSAAIFS